MSTFTAQLILLDLRSKIERLEKQVAALNARLNEHTFPNPDEDSSCTFHSEPEPSPSEKLQDELEPLPETYGKLHVG
jgi:hypothetical protein